MAKPIGRPRKVAAPELTSALVPAELLKRALREVAETPVEEMTIERFVENAAQELAAVFAGERPKAEIVRKLVPIVAGLGWHGQEEEITAMLDAYEAQQAMKNGVPVPSLAVTNSTAKAARRSADSKSSVKIESLGTADPVASATEPQPQEDDGYESFEVADSEALRGATATESAKPVTVPTETSGVAKPTTAAPDLGPGTQDQRSEVDARLGEPDQAKAEPTGAATTNSGTAPAPRDSGPLREAISRPAEDMPDSQPALRGTAPTVPARPTPGTLELPLGETNPDVSRARLPYPRPTHSSTAPSGQFTRLAGGPDLQGDGGSRPRP